MRSITQALFSVPTTNILKIGGEKPSQYIGDTGNPKSIKSTPIQPRVSKKELEVTYMIDPIVFNSVNKMVQTIMSAPHRLVSKDEKTKKFFDEFLISLGISGSNITWEELLTQIFLNQCIYGTSFTENIFNKKGNKIVDWDILDTKKLDYAKDGNGSIVLDHHQRPVGYVQTLPANIVIPEKMRIRGLNEKDSRVILPPNAIYLSAIRIAQTKLYEIGDGFYPLGIIEPIYYSALRKLNMEHALANAIYRHGFPIVHASMGDNNHEPTPQQVQSMVSKLKDINFKQEIATPYYMDLKILESKQVEKLQVHLEYFKNNEIAGLGIPETYATGMGGATNKAVLTAQTSLYQLTLKEIIQRTVASIRRYMFAPVAKTHGLKDIPTIEWDNVGVDEVVSKSERFVSYVREGIFTPEEVRPILSQGENIPIESVTIKKEEGEGDE